MIRIRDTPFGELVNAAVQDFCFVTREVFPPGKEPMEFFARDDELLDLFLDRHSRLSPSQRVSGKKHVKRSGNRGVDRLCRGFSTSRLSEEGARNCFCPARAILQAYPRTTTGSKNLCRPLGDPAGRRDPPVV